MNATGMAVGPNGDLYFVAGPSWTVHSLSSDGILRRVAGNGDRQLDTPAPDGFLALDASLEWPLDVAFDHEGKLLFTESRANAVRSVDANGKLGTEIRSNVLSPSMLAQASSGDLFLTLGASPSADYVGVRPAGQRGPEWILPLDNPKRVAGAPIRAIAPLPDGRLLVSLQNAISILDRAVTSIPQPWSTALGGVSAMAVHSSGLVFVAERPRAAIWKVRPDGIYERLTRAAGELSDLNEGGSSLETSIVSGTKLAVNDAGDLFIYDSALENVRRIARATECQGSAVPLPARSGVVNAASYRGGSVAPGLIVSIFGVNLGPLALAGAELTQDDRLATEVVGLRVLFDGVPAPVVYASASQTSVIVPYAVAGKQTTEMIVEWNGRKSSSMTFAVEEANPGLFTLDSSGTGQAAALNQDGSINGSGNPAGPGSIAVLYATGEGLTDPLPVNGKIARDVLPKPLLDVRVFVQGVEGEILYAGAAPGLTAGIMQVNVRLPMDLGAIGPKSVQLMIGTRRTESNVTVFVD